jgi:hypothetical protein
VPEDSSSHDESVEIYDLRVGLIAIRFREAGRDIGAELDEVHSRLAALMRSDPDMGVRDRR